MTRAIPVAVVALPFVTAAVLAAVASWRIGTWINAGSASLQFVVACLLVSRAGAAETHLVLLTAFVAMTTSWFGRRDIAAALAARSLGRRRARLYHVGYQALIGAVQAATLAGDPILTWLALVVAVAAAAAMTGAVRGPDAAAAASRLVLHCAIGLLLALLGTLLLDLTPAPASVFLLLGYGALAGLVPLHSWLANASAEGVAPGAIIVTLLANVPLMLFMRLDIAPGLLIAFGLASLLPGAVALSARLDRRRTVALAGMAQFGMVVFAIGVGAKQVAWLHMTLLALARSAVLQSHGDDILAWLALALLPLYALYLLAEPTVAVAAWLLVPLAAGALLACWALLERRPDRCRGRPARRDADLAAARTHRAAGVRDAGPGGRVVPRGGRGMSATMQPRRALTRDEWTRMAGEPSPPLLALWADTREVYALLRDGTAPLLVSTEVEDGGYPALSPSRPAAVWFERMVRDLWGHTAIGGTRSAALARPWALADQRAIGAASRAAWTLRGAGVSVSRGTRPAPAGSGPRRDRAGGASASWHPRRNHRAAGGAAGIHAQGHADADARQVAAGGGAVCRAPGGRGDGRALDCLRSCDRSGTRLRGSGARAGMA